MSQKIILLALAAASLAAFALPATAMAVEEDIALHLVPKPEGVKTMDGEGGATFATSIGSITCDSANGTATFTTSTTGTFGQTFHGCKGPLGEPCTTVGQPSGTITTTILELHLVTAVDTKTGARGPGVLLTPNNNHFGTFVCGTFIGQVVVDGNGLVGTIKSPECGKESTEATIEFSSSSNGVQTHKTVASTNINTGVTPTEYSLTAFNNPASVNVSMIITLGGETRLECT